MKNQTVKNASNDGLDRAVKLKFGKGCRVIEDIFYDYFEEVRH